MITLTYLNSLRDWIATGSGAVQVVSGGVGGGNLAVHVTDTGLNGNTNLGTSGTFANVTGSKLRTMTKQAIWEYNFATGTTATGTSFGEFGLDTGSTLFNRVVYEPIVKKEYTSLNYVVQLTIV